MDEKELQEAALGLLDRIGRRGPIRLRPLPGGSNNRLYEIRRAEEAFLLKVYFRHREDQRDRLGAEYAFCRFAWRRGIRSTPEPLAADASRAAALYGFICGRRLEKEEITPARIREAIEFCTELNRHREHPEARALPIASEACFSIQEHVSLVDRRMRRLAGTAPRSDADRQAACFVGERLAPAWRRIRERTLREASRLPRGADGWLDQSERRLSPSDLGFHNALLTQEGTLRFLDFEYAGWDDPAKLICDFLHQPALPVPPGSFDLVASSLSADQRDPEACRRRAELLFPLYRIKWCCIILNEFSPADAARRSFAQGANDREAAKKRQLQEAVRKLEEAPEESPPAAPP